MSSNQWIYDRDAIWVANQQCVQLANQLESIWLRANALKEKVEQYDGWQGKQKEELLGFLTLITMYHNDLACKSGNAFSLFVVALNRLVIDIENFQENSEVYQGLNQ